jgi:hypothetical protein
MEHCQEKDFCRHFQKRESHVRDMRRQDASEREIPSMNRDKNRLPSRASPGDFSNRNALL